MPSRRRLAYHGPVINIFKQVMKMKKAVLTMEPFSCPSCIKKIESTLLKVTGVREAKVLFHSGRVRIEFDSSMTSADMLESTVVRLGYPVLSKKVS